MRDDGVLKKEMEGGRWEEGGRVASGLGPMAPQG